MSPASGAAEPPADAAHRRLARVTGLDAGVAAALTAPLALWGARFLLVPLADGQWRGVVDPPSALRLASALAAGAGLAAVLSRHPSPVRRALLPLAVAAAPVLAVVAGGPAVLVAFQGPVMVVVAAACLAVALARSRARVLLPRVSGLSAFALGFSFYALVGLRIPGPAGLQGDEPHYLLMAQSLLSDGDLDLADEFAGREYAPFFAGTLAPHTSPSSPPGRVYAIHAPGLAALLLPAYTLGGAAGARLLLSALAALAGALLLRLGREALDDRAATTAWAVLTFLPPLPFHAVALYPETPALLASTVLLWSSRRDPGWIRSLAATAAAAALPWLHPKFLPLAVLGLGLTLVRRSPWRMRAAALAVLAASVGLLLWFFQVHYGRASLGAAYGAGLSSDVSLGRAPWGLAALFLDRQFGLFAVGPVWVLALPGAVLLLKRRAGDALRSALLAAAVLLPGASFSMWWGGACPPARFVLPALPALALAVAVAARARPRTAAGLAGASLAVVALAADAPRALHNRSDGESALLRLLAPGLDLDDWLPSFVPAGTLPAAVLCASLLAVLALSLRFRGRGLLLGLTGYGLVAASLADRPLLDPRLSTAQLLDAWDPERVRGPAGPPDLSRLSLPLDLGRAPWEVRSGDVRNSRRIDLPPGLYRVEVRSKVLEALPTAHVVRIDLAAGELVLQSDYVRAGGPAPSLELLLPAGVRRLALTAVGAQGRTLVEGASVVPLAVVPRPRRGDLPWPRLPEPGRYRVEGGGARVTVLDRSAPEEDGFALEGGEGSFLVESAPGSTVDLRVRRPRPDARDAVVWAGRRIPLGPLPETTLTATVEAGLVLGGTAVVPVRVEAPGARVSFAARSRP